jgi:hypothetical protein
MKQELQTTGETPERRQLGKRLEELALAMFLVMTGALWLAPDAWVPEGAWLAGVGLILLGLSAARHLHGLYVSGFGIAVGIAALAGGSGRILGIGHLFIPLLLIFLGTALLGKAISRKGNPDGTANASSGGKCC